MLNRANIAILDHWDLWSSRNHSPYSHTYPPILDHWDLWSSRNGSTRFDYLTGILDHWDLWSSRNREPDELLSLADFRSLGFVV